MEAELIPGLPDDVALQCLLRLPFLSILVAQGVCRRWKHELASSSFYSLRKAAGLVRLVVVLLLQGKHLSHADRCHLVFFEPSTGALTTRRLIADRAYAMQGCSDIVIVGRELVLVDGWDDFASRPTGEINIYDIVTGEWRQGAPMPPPLRNSYICAAGPRTVFVSGGRDATTRKKIFSVLAYDTATDAWVEFDGATRWPWWAAYSDPPRRFMKKPEQMCIQWAAHVAADEERRMDLYRDKGEQVEVLLWSGGDIASLWRSSGVSLDNFPEYFRSFFVFQF